MSKNLPGDIVLETDPVAEILADLECDSAREVAENENREIGLRRLSLFNEVFVTPTVSAVGSWITAWERFLVAQREGQDCDRIAAIHEISRQLRSLQATWNEWKEAHAHWYVTHAEPWNQRVSELKLGSIPPNLPFSAIVDHPWLEPLLRFEGGPMAILTAIPQGYLFQQYTSFATSFPGNAIRAILVCIKRPDSASKILPTLKTQWDRVADLSLAIAACILPSPAVIGRFIETRPTEQTLQDARQLFRMVPDFIYKLTLSEFDARVAAQRAVRAVTEAPAIPRLEAADVLQTCEMSELGHAAQTAVDVMPPLIHKPEPVSNIESPRLGTQACAPTESLPSLPDGVHPPNTLAYGGLTAKIPRAAYALLKYAMEFTVNLRV